MSLQGVAIASLVLGLITLTVSVLLAVLVLSPDTWTQPASKPTPGPKPDPAPGTPDPTFSTIDQRSFKFKGPGKGDAIMYYIVPLHNFTAVHKSMFLQSVDALNQAFTLSIDKFGSGVDRCDFQVMLFDKPLTTMNQLVDALPQKNAPSWQGNRLEATRDKDAIIDVSKVQACLVPGQNYNLALVLTFHPDVATNDWVTYTAPAVVMTQTSTAADAKCK